MKEKRSLPRNLALLQVPLKIMLIKTCERKEVLTSQPCLVASSPENYAYKKTCERKEVFTSQPCVVASSPENYAYKKTC